MKRNLHNCICTLVTLLLITDAFGQPSAQAQFEISLSRNPLHQISLGPSDQDSDPNSQDSADIHYIKRDDALGGGIGVIGTYYATLNVAGQPKRLLIDTGSSVTYVAGKNCVVYDGDKALHTCYTIGTPVSLEDTAVYPCNLGGCNSCDGSKCLVSNSYADGSSVHAVARNTRVAVGKVSAISPVGVVYRSSKGYRFDRSNYMDGLFGLGYRNKQLPTVLDSWISQSNVSDAFAIQLGPNGGALSLGGYNPAYFEGELKWTRITSTNAWYTVPTPAIMIAGKTVSKTKNAVSVIDSGTTHLLIPSREFDSLVSYIKEEVSRSRGSCPSTVCGPWATSVFNRDLCFTELPTTGMPSITFQFESKRNLDEPSRVGETFQLTMSHQDYFIVGGSKEGRPCYTFGIGKGSSSLYIFGDTFMTSFYTVFDRQNLRIGFARSRKASSVVPTNTPVTLTLVPGLANSSPQIQSSKFLILAMLLSVVWLAF